MFGLNRYQTFQQCWAQLPFGYKFLFIFTLIYNTLTLIFPFLLTSFYFNAYSVVHQFQIWRLLIPFIPSGFMPFSILNIGINFLLLLVFYPPIQKQYSTAYILMETFIQNLLIYLVMCVMSIVIHIIFQVNSTDYPILSYGINPMIMIFIWHRASQNPDQHTTFCCLPCLIPMRFTPYVMLGLSFFFASSFIIPLIIAFALGYLQFMFLKRRLIKIPLKLYRKIDMILPKSITQRRDYVKVSTVQNILRSECSQSNRNNEEVRENNRNPFTRNRQQNNNQQNKVQVIGNGVSIGGGSNSQNFRGFWVQKNDEIKQIQIEPNPAPIHKQNYTEYTRKQNQTKNIDRQYFEGNDSRMKFDNQQTQKQSEQQIIEKQQKKLAKVNLLE